MAFNQATWIDRDSEHPNRRTLQNVNDPTDVKTYDVSRAEGTVTTQGTPIGASTLNDLENRIASAFTALNPAWQTITLEATDWDSATHTITVSVTGVTLSSNQEIVGLPATSAANISNNQALLEANIMDYGQAVGQITLYAENVPVVDLQIRVQVRA